MKKSKAMCLALLISGLMLMNIDAFCAGKKEVSMKNLIVYYSYTGKTESVAKTLAENIQADLIKVEDIERPSTFKAYFWGAYAARKGQTWPIKPVNPDITKYERIFVGAPIWWGKTAPEMNTFIDQTNFNGKQVVVFVTMAGSSPEMAIKALSERVASKGGKIVSSFSIKTGMGKNIDISTKTKEIAGQYK